ncbi:MAG: serine--tRNA ligase [Marinilabiliaceae bacterium]|nr:serine--tRNA ligase [Marinilabiliaceae bacterium]
MVTLKLIQENKADLINRLKIKHFDASRIIDEIILHDNLRKSTQAELDNKQAEMNSLSKSIGELFKIGKNEEANLAKVKTASLKDDIKILNDKHTQIETELFALLVQIPNPPHHSVQEGKTADDNIEISSGGTIPTLQDPLPHWDLAKNYDLIDFELGNKITGAGFPVYKGIGAKLHRALISFFLDEAIKGGYKEVMPPLMVNEASAFGTGQLPDKEGQMYHVTVDNLFLIPTAEVTITNLYRDVILTAAQLPIKNCAYSACFRREAGSYGKEVRGLNRLHQFDKVEIVQIAHPEQSYNVLEKMTEHVQSLLEKLELPWRKIRLCGGDMSFHSALTYDFEVYSAAQERWLEVSSVSNFETFQSNRLKLRFKDDTMKKSELTHTLNGSALALPRIVAALLENNQSKEGIKIPKVLIPYLGVETI